MSRARGSPTAVSLPDAPDRPVWETSGGDPEPLARVLENLHTVMLAHLTDEEAELLPLVGEHLTAAEWAGSATTRGVTCARGSSR